AAERAQLALVLLEYRALAQVGDLVADAQAVFPAVAGLAGEGHGAVGLHAHVAGGVVGAERLQRERRQGGAQQAQQQRKAGQGAGPVHAQAPRYSIRRRSTSSSPSSRCRMRIGVGTPSATHSRVWSPCWSRRSTRSAS